MTQPTSAQAAERVQGAASGRAAALAPAVTPKGAAAKSRALPPDRPKWRPDPGWREVLAGPQPDQILARLLDGDPLRLRWLVAAEIRGGAYFLNADRVQLRALARIAHDGPVDREPADGAWVLDHVQGAVEDVLLEERRATAGRGPRTPDQDSPLGVFDALASPLGLQGAELRVACDAFNRLEFANRRAFFALFIERLSLDAAAKACQVAPVELGRRARVALVGTLNAVKKFAARPLRESAESPAGKGGRR